MKYTTIALPDDFEKGDCERCPFSFLDYDIDGDPYDDCVFEWHREPCKLEVGEVVHIEDKVYKALKPRHKTTAHDGECVIGGFWEIEKEEVWGM